MIFGVYSIFRAVKETLQAKINSLNVCPYKRQRTPKAIRIQHLNSAEIIFIYSP